MPLPDWTTMSTAERAEALRPLIADGMTASQIAAHFFGVSRNGIIGFSHRHKMPLANSRPPTRGQNAPIKTRRPPRPIGNTASVPLPPLPPPPETAVIYMDALNRGLCKWPLWGEFEGPYVSECCGSPRADDGPYCAYHSARHSGRGSESERSAHRTLEKYA